MCVCVCVSVDVCSAFSSLDKVYAKEMYTLRDITKGSGGTGDSAHSQKGLAKPVPDCCDCWLPPPPGWQLLLHMCTKVCEHNSTQVWLSFLWLHHLIIRITACLRPLALQPDRGSTMQTNIPVMLIYLRDLYLVKMVTWLSGGHKIPFVMSNSPYWPVHENMLWQVKSEAYRSFITTNPHTLCQ